MARKKHVEQRQPLRKYSQLDKAELDNVDYKDTQLLRKFMTKLNHVVLLAFVRNTSTTLLWLSSALVKWRYCHTP